MIDPREPLPHEQREMHGRNWRLPLTRDAARNASVRVLLDDGRVLETITRSEPWQIGSGHWVVLIVGRSGGMALERVTPL
jgi:hypothetical protein